MQVIIRRKPQLRYRDQNEIWRKKYFLRLLPVNSLRDLGPRFQNPAEAIKNFCEKKTNFNYL